MRQVWYADDALAAGKLATLKCWCDKLFSLSPAFGYFANASKTRLVTKYLEEFLADAINSTYGADALALAQMSTELTQATCMHCYKFQTPADTMSW